MIEYKRPPTRSNLSICNIIQIILMLFIGIIKARELYSNLSNFNFTFTNLISLASDGFIILGIIIFTYGLFGEQSKYLKMGLIFFLFGSLISFLFSLFDLFKEKTKIISIGGLIIYGLISWIIFSQIPNI